MEQNHCYTQTLTFQNNLIQTIPKTHKTWFVAADVCTALDIADARKALGTSNFQAIMETMQALRDDHPKKYGEAHIKISNPKAMADILTDAVGDIWAIVDGLEDAHTSQVRMIKGGAIR